MGDGRHGGVAYSVRNQGVVQDDPKLTLSPETEAYNQLPNCNPKEPDRTQELGRTQILPEGMWW